MRKKLGVPKFENEAEEAKFWANLDPSEYFEPSDFKRGVVFPSLKRTKRLISIRLPEQLLMKVKDKDHLQSGHGRFLRRSRGGRMKGSLHLSRARSSSATRESGCCVTI